MSAIRLARGFTGREKVVKFAGNYHGHVDSLLVAAGSSAATLSVPNSPGITQGAADNTIVRSYNDASAVRELFAQRGEEIAAVILEPIVGNMGCVIPEPSFLDALRKETQAYESVLIYDEVMTGFPRCVRRRTIAARDKTGSHHAWKNRGGGCRRRPTAVAQTLWITFSGGAYLSGRYAQR